MRYTIHIETDSDAFALRKGVELARVLRELADKVEGFELDKPNRGVIFPLFDVNGNRCGEHWHGPRRRSRKL